MSTNYLSLTPEIFIREAYNSIGLSSTSLDAYHFSSALTHLNFIFLEWVNDGVELFRAEQIFLPTAPEKVIYELPSNIDQIYYVRYREIEPITGYSITSSLGDGVADKLFSDTNTEEVSLGVDGFVTLSTTNAFDVTVKMIGIKAIAGTYDLNIYNNDNQLLYSLDSFTFTQTDMIWLPLPEFIKSSSFKLKAKDDTVDLTLIRIVYGTVLSDRDMTLTSLYQATRSYNYSAGIPVYYYYDRLAQNSILKINVPAASPNACLSLTISSMINQVNDLSGIIPIPPRYYPALLNYLSAKLSLNYAPEKAGLFESRYQVLMEKALNNDSLLEDLYIIPKV